MFDHTTRIDDQFRAPDEGSRTAVRRAHNDNTIDSAAKRVRDLLPTDEAEELLKKRYAIVNVWRPITGPVEQAPLAFADARSVSPEDFVAVEMVYDDRVGGIYSVLYNEKQNWFYFPRLDTDEVLLLKIFDSAEDGRARFTAHTAIDDPTTEPDAAPRESIESRTILFFDED